MRFVLFALAIGVAACASGPSAAPGSAAAQHGESSKPRQICKEEAATGSHISHIVCRTPEEDEQNREGARKWSVAPNSTAPVTK